MSKFAVELKNNFRLYSKSLLNPIIIFVVLDILAIIAFFIFKFHTGLGYEELVNLDIKTEIEMNSPEMVKLLWSMIGMGSLGIIGFVMVLIGLGLSGSALNFDNMRKCEIFYRTQPVSVWQYAGSKYLTAILGPALVMIAIGLFNLILLIPFVSPVLKVYLLPAISGLFSTALLYLRSLIVVGSLGFLASAVFREKALQKLLMLIIALHFAFLFSHIVMGFPRIDILEYLFKLINPLQNFADFTNIESANTFEDVSRYLNINTLLFNWHSLLQIGVSAVFFISGVLIYSKREIN